MELFSGITEEKYEMYRSCQNDWEKTDPEEIGQVWADRICVSIFNCGSCLDMEISTDGTVDIERDVPLEFSCDKKLENVNYEEFQAVLKEFLENWVDTYAPVLKEPVLEMDFPITRENQPCEELEEYELEL